MQILSCLFVKFSSELLILPRHNHVVTLSFLYQLHETRCSFTAQTVQLLSQLFGESMIALALDLTAFGHPHHRYLVVVLHPLMDLVHMSHGQTSCVSLTFQFLKSESRTLVFLFHLNDLGDQGLDDALVLLDLALMEHLLRKMR